MTKKLIIGVIGSKKIGPWIIPQKIQNLICHDAISDSKEKISFISTEYVQSSGIPSLLGYIKKNKKKIKKIIFVSIFQLGEKESEISENLNKIKKYDCYFYLEDQKTKNLSLKSFKYYIKELLRMKYYPFKKFGYKTKI
jgi:sporadic carbohydrate cluster protein (TIGR04323 family)